MKIESDAHEGNQVDATTTATMTAMSDAENNNQPKQI